MLGEAGPPAPPYSTGSVKACFPGRVAGRDQWLRSLERGRAPLKRKRGPRKLLASSQWSPAC